MFSLVWELCYLHGEQLWGVHWCLESQGVEPEGRAVCCWPHSSAPQIEEDLQGVQTITIVALL